LEGLEAEGRLPESEAARPALVEMATLVSAYLRAPPRERRVPPASPDYVELASRHRSGRNRKQFQFVSGQ
jgi:hypothetical protein